MSLIDSYLIDILPSVSGCPEQTATRAVIQAIREFCRDTNSLQTTVKITTIKNIASYSLNSPVGTRVIGVEKATFNGVKLTPTSEEEMDRQVHSWRNISGDPTHYLMDGLSMIVLYRMPDKLTLNGLEARLSLMITDEAIEIDGEFYDLYHDAITAGAKARLMAIPKKPWTDLTISTYFRDQFDQEKAMARVRSVKGNVKRSLSVKPVRFG